MRKRRRQKCGVLKTIPNRVHKRFNAKGLLFFSRFGHIVKIRG